MKKIEAIDLFCGVGGLTYGLGKANIDVIAGVDIDPASRFPYEANNDSKFIEKSVEELAGRALRKMYSTGSVRVLAGCAPCQPFSKYSQGPKGKGDNQWKLLSDFARLVDESNPDIVTMENVPALINHPIFGSFVKTLSNYPSGRKRYHVSYQLVDCEKYGLPQTRKRLVLLASRLGAIEFCKPTRQSGSYKTVQDAIKKLPMLTAGEESKADPMHKSCLLNELNLQRIRQSKPGGTWRDWNENLVAECHKKATGKTYVAVYGRMEWDKPAPTITTQFFGYGNGRFGHPSQDRALSLREGASIQSFPKSYKFVAPGEKPEFKIVGRLIGNAVPVRLGEVIGMSIAKHVEKHC